MENESLTSVIGSSAAPYQTSLARACASASNYNAISHPSLPNYLAATGGSTFGVTDDGEPDVHPIESASLFSELDSAHESWRAFDESMPVNCDLVTSGEYAARHNPAVYYRQIRAACRQDDVPLGSLADGAFASAASTGTLPVFSFVTPNICDDAHSCAVSVGDAWLHHFFNVLFASPEYRSGSTVAFITYDEGNGDNRVPLIVARASMKTGTRLTSPYSHYSLLRTTEELLGLNALGNARQAKSILDALGLGVGRPAPSGT